MDIEVKASGSALYFAQNKSTVKLGVSDLRHLDQTDPGTADRCETLSHI